MNTLARLSLHWLLLASAAQAQLPSAEVLAMAVRATAAQARQAGLALQEGALWRTALRHRKPLVAAHVQGTCHLGYSAYTPGRDYHWLFPTPRRLAGTAAGLAAALRAGRLEPRPQPQRQQRVAAAKAAGGAGVVADRQVVEEQLAADLGARKGTQVRMQAQRRLGRDDVVDLVRRVAAAGQDVVDACLLYTSDAADE